jgi:hypothetical protein
MKKSLLTVLIGVFIIAASNAQGISGNWKSTLEGPQGSMELTYVFKVDGKILTGTETSPMGGQEIKNGVVNGNEFSYEIDMMGNTMKLTGKLENDVIKLKMHMPEGGDEGPGGPGGPGELTLTRVK